MGTEVTKTDWLSERLAIAERADMVPGEVAIERDPRFKIASVVLVILFFALFEPINMLGSIFVLFTQTFLVLYLFLFMVLSRGRQKRSFSVYEKLLGLYVVVALVSTFLNWGSDAWYNTKAPGDLLKMLISLFLVVLIVAYYVSSPLLIIRFLKRCLLVSIPYVLMAKSEIFNDFFTNVPLAGRESLLYEQALDVGEGTDKFRRESFLWVDTNFYAHLMVILIVIALLFILTAKQKNRKIAGLFLIMVYLSSLLNTASRGGFTLLLATALAFFLFHPKFQGKRFVTSVSTATVAFLLMYGLRYVGHQGATVLTDRVLSFFSFIGSSDQALYSPTVETGNFHTLTWIAALGQYLENPVVGVGPIPVGDFGYGGNHNHWITVFAQFGTAAGLLYYGTLLMILYRLLKRIRHQMSKESLLLNLVLAILMLETLIQHWFAQPSYYNAIIIGLAVSFINSRASAKVEQRSLALRLQGEENTCALPSHP